MNDVLAMTVAGDQQRVRSWVDSVIERTGADELMLDSRIYDPDARARSHEYIAKAIIDSETKKL